MAVEYLKSNKGSDLLVLENLTYVTEKIYTGKHMWRCTEYRTAKCKSKCHTKNNIVTKQPTEHNHVADVAKVKAKKVVNEMKDSDLVRYLPGFLLSIRRYVKRYGSSL